MSSKISRSGKRPALYSHSTWTNFTLLERMYLEFYAERFNTDVSDIVRGMVRKFVDKDRSFSPEEFTKTAQKVLIPREDDATTRKEMKRVLGDLKRAG